jgi:hypothetical protein
VNINPTEPLTAQLRAHGLAQHCSGASALLYRFRDAEGGLLHVGVTVNPPIRWQAHRNRAEWWEQVATVDIEDHPYMNAALDAELTAIRAEAPRFNLRSVAERPAGDSAPSRGTSPQGKGGEGIRKGREGNATAIRSLVDVGQVALHLKSLTGPSHAMPRAER